MELAANHGNWNSIPAWVADAVPEPAIQRRGRPVGVLPWKVV